MSSAPPDEPVARLWKTARFLPQTVRLLGTRYRALFLAHARSCSPRGEAPVVADAMAFAAFLKTQERVGLLDNEKDALRRDENRLRRRFRLRREGAAVEAREKWRLLRWTTL